ncbi:hypothetical protein PAECIP111890_02825 [Paenibacillus sp. JJ-223]|nr:hypothetical protein PAECIP111890_02825 [Paenibacillus sp. JJ-223]
MKPGNRRHNRTVLILAATKCTYIEALLLLRDERGAYPFYI